LRAAAGWRGHRGQQKLAVALDVQDVDGDRVDVRSGELTEERLSGAGKNCFRGPGSGRRERRIAVRKLAANCGLSCAPDWSSDSRAAQMLSRVPDIAESIRAGGGDYGTVGVSPERKSVRCTAA